MSVSISNVKLSLKIPNISLCYINDICKLRNIEYSQYNNFTVLRCNPYTYTIFKVSLLKKCEKNFSHVNIITPLLDCVNDAIKKLLQLVNQEDFNFMFKIDNLTCSGKHPKRIDVSKFMTVNHDITHNISYNKEKFPAIFIVHKNRTILLFRSGSIIILASKSLEQAEESFKWIIQRCVNT